MAWNPTLTTLRDILSGLYFTSVQARNVADEAGINTRRVVFTGAAQDDWHNILRQAHFEGKVTAVALVAAKEYPQIETLRKIAEGGEVAPVRGPDFTSQLRWLSSELGDTLEKIIGKQSTFLDINFLELGVERAKSVARIELANGDFGTAFLIGNNLLVTNHHVLPDRATATTAKAQFNFQRSTAGLLTRADEFSLLPNEVFATSPQSENDWSVVRVNGNPNKTYGMLALVRVDPKRGDPVNIVQHPDGQRKQIALYHNTIAFVNDSRIQYLTDTLPGSSGSPGFDSQWRVITLHHSGGWLQEPGTKNTYWRNEGIHINAVIDGIEAAGLLPT